MPENIGCTGFLQNDFSALGPQNAYPANYELWVSNNVAPDQSIGNTGDWFMNVTSNSLVVYQKVAPNIWTPYCTLAGPASSISSNPPITIASGVIGITQASAGSNGYLSSTDWNTFHSKQPAGSYLVATNNLADLNSVSSARTNLGLGTAATQASSSFAPATTATTSQLLAGSGSGGFTNVTLGTGLSFTGSTLNVGISATAGGTNGQIQYNNSTALGGFTMSGDATLVTSTGVITVTKSSGNTILGAAFKAVNFFQAASVTLASIAALSDSAGYLKNDGSGNLTWASVSGSGNVSTSGTITSGYTAQWNAATTIIAVANTGTGSYVLNTSPTLVTPLLGTPTSGTLTNCTFPTLNQNTTGTAGNLSGTPTLPNGVKATTQSAGTSNTTLATTAFVANALTLLSGTVNPQTGAYELVLSDANGTVYHPSGGAVAWTIPSYTGGTNPVDFPINTVIVLVNDPSGGGIITVSMSGSDTMFVNGGTGVVSSFTIAVSHAAAIQKIADSPGRWMVNLN